MPEKHSNSPDDLASGRRDTGATREGRVRFLGESYRLLFEKNPLPMWVYDLKSLRFLAVNEAAVRHYGYTRDEFLAMTIKDIRPPEDVSALLKEIDHLNSETQTFGIWRHLKKDGSLIDVEVLGTEIDFNDHRARLTLAHDITERLRAERQLRTAYAVTAVLSEAPSFQEAIPKLLRAICETAQWEYGELWLATTSPEGLGWAGAWKVPGFPSEPLEAASHAIFVQRGIGIPGTTWATGRPGWLTELTPEAQIMRAEVAARLQLRQALSFPIRGRSGRILGVMVFFSRAVREPDENFLDLMSDLGNRIGQSLEGERSERERRSLEERFSKAFYKNPLPAVLTQVDDGRIIDANDSFLRLFGYERDEILGRKTLDLGMWDDPTQRERIMAQVRDSRGVHAEELRIRTRSGERRSVLVSIESISLAERPTILTTIVDVTDLRNAQRRILEMDRLASIGQTAAFVAHQISTPLTNIALLTANLERQTQDAPAIDKLTRIDEQRRMAAKILEQVLNLSGTAELSREPTDLAILLRDAAEQVASFRKPDVALQADVDTGGPRIDVDPMRIHQAFVNLLKNAFQSTERGSVTITLRQDGDSTVIEVRDTGAGMTPEVRAHLFEPFYTTRPRGQGVGLGLAFVRNVVTAHGGSLEVDSEPGKGTTITVRIPRGASAT